jgi:4,5-dihydroxyphthalate decarboxylase
LRLYRIWQILRGFHGEIDWIFSTNPPTPVEEGKDTIVHLYPNYREAEEQYYLDIGIFPINYLIAMRGDFLHENLWVTTNLYKAFEEAEKRALFRATEMTATVMLFSCCDEATQKDKDLFGDDYVPYGIERNRATLEAFLQCGFEQGVGTLKLEVEELSLEQVTKVLTEFQV